MLAVGGKGGWALSHFFCQGQSPLQQWKPNNNNPVVKNGQLFAAICSGEGKHCSQGMVDEGTPEIVEKMAGEFYVTFHGYDYGRKQAARGIARTSDFVNWNVIGGAGGLSGDVMFSREDCQWPEVPWEGEGGCIGSGQASIVRGRSGFMYQVVSVNVAAVTTMLNMMFVSEYDPGQVIEVADKELGCETGWNSQVSLQEPSFKCKE